MNQPVKRSTDRNSKVMHPPTRRSPDRNAKVTYYQQPKQLVIEHPSSPSELERQITQLQEDLRRAREQIALTESHRREVEQEVEEAKKQISILHTKYEESQRQTADIVASEEGRIRELRKLSQERDQIWKTELEALQKQRSLDFTTLSSAMNEIQRLKTQLSRTIKSESAYAEQCEIANAELEELKEEIERALYTIQNLKIQIMDSEQAKAKAEAMARESQHELEIAKSTMETLLSDGSALMESFNSIVSELEKSRAEENILEETIKKLQADQHTTGSPFGCSCLESEVEQLTLALENTEVKYQEQQIQNTILIQSIHEFVELLGNDSILRQADLQAALTDTKAEIVEVKARVLEKEDHIQGASYLNETLHSGISVQPDQVKSSFSLERVRSTAEIAELKEIILAKDKELKGLLEENKLLKSEIEERESRHKICIADAELATAEEEKALVRLATATEELESSSIKVARLNDQLNAAQAVNKEMEVELKKQKVQLEQWKKAAETAMAVLTTGNNESFVEKLMNSPSSDKLDGDPAKTRNHTMLRKMGELWKKSQK